MPDLIERARLYASAAHRDVGQLRKYSGQPYEEHLRRVADIVAGVTDDAEVIAAAWLHDVVEDTPTTIEDVGREFGPGVRELVDAVTDVSRPHHGNRAARKALDREHLARAPARAQTVKLADLIDNCQDICRHSPRFGRVFLGEMAALLAVLTAGDAALRKRAQKTMDRWSGRLASLPESRPRPAAPAAAAAITGVADTGTAAGTAAPAGPAPSGIVRRAARIFAGTFCAADIAQPLRSFDATSPAAQADGVAGCPVLGVREDGRVVGYVARGELGSGRFADAMHRIVPTQVLRRRAGLADVVLALHRHEFCFVSFRGEIGAYVGRDEMQGPFARMWLFGMLTSFELAMTEGIRALGDGVDWTGLVTPARLDKARALQAARAALGRSVPLLDCLQLSDKIRISLALDDQALPFLRGGSKAETQRFARDLEELRNSLAHAQDIVTHDWAQIARIARRLEELATD